MKTINDGGPAFPHGPLGDTMHGEDGRVWHQYPAMAGMTLRDWFAGQALAGCLSSQTEESHWVFSVFPNDEHNDTKSLTGIASLCYDLADAMIAARKGNE